MLLLFLLLAAGQAYALDGASLQRVQANARSISKYSWEVGTVIEAALENQWPKWTVYGSDPFGKHPQRTMPAILKTVDPILRLRQDGTELMDGDGSSGDPASLIPSVLLASRWHAQNATKYTKAVTQELSLLLHKAPRSKSGAISHRWSQVSLWADFVYMAPPSLAYAAAWYSDANLMREAIDQVTSYWAALRESHGVVIHIAAGSTFGDRYTWATGSAWFAAGTVRTLATIDKSQYKARFASERAQLAKITNTILTAAYKTRQNSSALVPNYLFPSGSRPRFQDPAASALLASASYRLAQLGYSSTTITAAEQIRKVVLSRLSSSGWLQGCVDPMNPQQQLGPNQHSPEGNSFVVLMEAARRDWLAAKKQTHTSRAKLRRGLQPLRANSL